MDDFIPVSTDVLRAGSAVIDSDLAPSVVSIDLERLKVGTVRISNELVSVTVNASLDTPAHEPDCEFEIGAEAKHVSDALIESPECILEAHSGLPFEISVPRVAQRERRRRVLVRVVDVHDSSSSVGASAVTDAGSSTPDPTEGEPHADPIRIVGGEHRP